MKKDKVPSTKNQSYESDVIEKNLWFDQKREKNRSIRNIMGSCL
jgi:hypothetical protein